MYEVFYVSIYEHFHLIFKNVKDLFRVEKIQHWNGSFTNRKCYNTYQYTKYKYL